MVKDCWRGGASRAFLSRQQDKENTRNELLAVWLVWGWSLWCCWSLVYLSVWAKAVWTGWPHLTGWEWLIFLIVGRKVVGATGRWQITEVAELGSCAKGADVSFGRSNDREWVKSRRKERILLRLWCRWHCQDMTWKTAYNVCIMHWLQPLLEREWTKWWLA